MDEKTDVIEFSEGILQFLDTLAEDLFAEDLEKYNQGDEACQTLQESKN